MNYFKARQRVDGRWDYTCQNDGYIWPYGYCAGYREFEPGQPFSASHCARLNAEQEPFKLKYHTDGHATPDEAYACHREYELDSSLRFYEDSDKTETQHKCEICGVWTSGRAQVGGMKHWDLCAEHRTRECVEKLYPESGEVWSS